MDPVLSKEFLSQFKTEADVSKFLKQLHVQVLEKILEGEMDVHLGYEKILLQEKSGCSGMAEPPFGPSLSHSLDGDGIVFKVRDNGKTINKTVYLCVGLKQNGLKEVPDMWVGKSESSSFWMGVLTDLKARGVQDILISEWIYGHHSTRIPSIIHSDLCGTSDQKHLSLMEIEKKWTQPIHNWGLIMNQFMLIKKNRIQI